MPSENIEIRFTTSGAEKVKGQVSGIQKELERMAKNVVSVYAAYKAFNYIAKETMDAERATVSLNAALQQTGKFSAQTSQALLDHASALQKLTIYEDDAITQATAFMQSIGNLAAEDLPRAQKAAIGLAAAFNMDLQTAFMLVGKAAAGSTQMLGRYGIIIDDSLSKEEKLAKVLEIGASKFSLAEAQAKTAAGQIEQLKNTMSELAENIGAALLPVLKILASIVTPIMNLLSKIPSSVYAIIGITATLIITLKNLTGIITIVRTNFALLTGALATNPIGLAIGLIGAAVAGVTMIFAKHKEQTQALTNEMDSFAQQNAEIAKNATVEAEKFKVLSGRLLELKKSTMLTKAEQGEMSGLIKTLNRDYGQYLRNLDLEKTSYEDLAIAVNKVADALMKKAMAEGAKQMLTNTAAQVVAINREIAKTERELGGLQKDRRKFDLLAGETAESYMGGFGSAMDERDKKRIAALNAQLTNLRKQLKDAQADLQEYANAVTDSLDGIDWSGSDANIEKAGREIGDKLGESGTKRLAERFAAWFAKWSSEIKLPAAETSGYTILPDDLKPPESEDAFEEWKKTHQFMVDSIESVVSSTMSAFAQMMQGGRRMGDVMKQVFKDWVSFAIQELSRLLVKMALLKVFEYATNPAGSVVSKGIAASDTWTGGGLLQGYTRPRYEPLPVGSGETTLFRALTRLTSAVENNQPVVYTQLIEGVPLRNAVKRAELKANMLGALNTYYLRIEDSLDTDSGYLTIPHTDIIALQIDDNQAANDDPFEICGRTAKISVINVEPYNLWVRGLTDNGLPLSRYGFGFEIGRNYDYYTQLVRVMCHIDGTSAASDYPVFTGLIHKTGIGFDLFNDTLSITVCDTLHIWITLTRNTKEYSTTIIKSQDQTNPALWEYPTLAEFLSDPLKLLDSPLASATYSVDAIADNIVENVEFPLPGCTKPPWGWEWADILDATNNPDDWCVLGQYQFAFWPIAGSLNFRVVFFTLYRLIQTDTGEAYKLRYYTCDLYKYNVLQPLAFHEGTLDSMRSLSQVHLLLKYAGCLPSDAVLSYQTVTAYTGDAFENPLPNQTAPCWGNVESDQIIYNSATTPQQYLQLNTTGTTGVPLFGTLGGNINMTPEYVNTDGDNSVADIAKALCAIYGVSLRSLPAGGIEIYPHLIKTLGTGTPISITAADVINVTAQGLISDIKGVAQSLSLFANSDFLIKLFDKYYGDFVNSIRATYRVILPRSYADNYEWNPFQPITVRDKTMYVNKWSVPLYADTFEIEALGDW